MPLKAVELHLVRIVYLQKITNTFAYPDIKQIKRIFLVLIKCFFSSL